jgi:hypothetical protein
MLVDPPCGNLGLRNRMARLIVVAREVERAGTRQFTAGTRQQSAPRRVQVDRFCQGIDEADPEGRSGESGLNFIALAGTAGPDPRLSGHGGPYVPRPGTGR